MARAKSQPNLVSRLVGLESTLEYFDCKGFTRVSLLRLLFIFGGIVCPPLSCSSGPTMFQLPPNIFYRYLEHCYLEMTVRCCLPSVVPSLSLPSCVFHCTPGLYSSSTWGRLPCRHGVLQTASTQRVLVMTDHAPGVTLRQMWPTQFHEAKKIGLKGSRCPRGGGELGFSKNLSNL